MPGVPGIGVKTAAQLIGEYGDLETLLSARQRDQAGQAPPDADRQRRSRAHFEEARHPRPATCPRCAGRRSRRARARLQDADRVPQGDGVHTLTPPRRRKERHRSERDRGGCKIGIERSLPPRPTYLPERKTGDLFASAPQTTPRAKSETNGALTPISLAAAQGAEPRAEQKIDRSKYECVRTLARLKEWVGAKVRTHSYFRAVESCCLRAASARAAAREMGVRAPFVSLLARGVVCGADANKSPVFPPNTLGAGAGALDTNFASASTTLTSMRLVVRRGG